mgnify:CR=1 FL=1
MKPSELNNNRSFNSAFDANFLKNYQQGTLAYTYKGVRCLKSPIDLAIYLKLIWDLKPAAILEIGSKEGGSALWFKDMATVFGLSCDVISIDINPPSDLEDVGIKFLQGDVTDLESAFDQHNLSSLPHPWLVVEDSAHSYLACSAALKSMSKIMSKGDVLVMEDGILDELGLSDQYDGGPNRALLEFFKSNPQEFSVMPDYCDQFGENCTYNPNAYLYKN